MKVFCLGGAGKICRESILDLVQFSNFNRITVADFNESEGRNVVEWLNDPRVDFVNVDVMNFKDTIEKMKGYDIVMDGTQITLNGITTRLIAEAGCHGINLNGFGEENTSDHIFRENNKTMVPGFGMTPGTTQMMAMYAANQLDSVESVRISHGSYRPIAFSKSITETTTYEYDPLLPGRVVFEDGEFKQVPPLARPRVIDLPQPYGPAEQYIIPHSETVTLVKNLKQKGVKLIEVRGTWPPKNMELIKALYHWGILKNEKIKINNIEVGIMDCISEYLISSKIGTETELYGYALHVEVIGMKEAKKIKHVLWHTHPASDGSVEGWEGLRAYTRNVGIPMAIATEMIASGQYSKLTGVITPEEAFNPKEIFNQLKKRHMYVHEKIEEIV